MRYLSLFSGVESATLAWEPIGWKPVAFAEFDPFPSAVLAHHYPHVPNLGDVTKIEGSKLRGTVELIVGGSPCQGFSVAGKQKGLDDPRSGLALAYVRLLDEVRPKWFVWENVPGVLSTNGGNDFKAFIDAITEIGYSCAWRILDAQYVRVDGFPNAIPQRRRRLFVVGHLADWRYPAEVLFEQESLRWDSEESGCEREGASGTVEEVSRKSDKNVGIETAVTLKIRSGCEGGGKGALWQVEKSATLATNNDQTLFQPERAFTQGGFGGYDEGVGTLRASGGDLGGGSETLIATVAPEKYPRMLDDVCPTLLAGAAQRGWSGAQEAFTGKHFVYDMTHANEVIRDVSGPIIPTPQARMGTGGNQVPLVLFNKEGPVFSLAENTIGRKPQNGGNGTGFSKDVSYTLNATGVHGVSDSLMRVRRLTPIECERLMGFPDDYTKVPYRGKSAEDCPDTQRYKACGNSMCVNVMRWIGQRIQACEERHGGTANVLDNH